MNKENCDLIRDFKEGDLLYGLENEARVYSYDELLGQLKAANAKYTFITQDDINRQLGSIIFESNYSMSPLRGCQTPVKEHAAFILQHDKFHPRTPESVVKSEKKLYRKQLYSCLAGILNCKGKIRFCLDGIDMMEVRNPDCSRYKSYTSKELRFIARRYAELSDKVVFYFKGMQVEAPWVEESLSPEVWLKSYAMEPRLIIEDTQYTTPQKGKRSRADVIKATFLTRSADVKHQLQTKCPKFDDEERVTQHSP